MNMKRVFALALMALLLCLPVWAMANETPTIMKKIEITAPEPKVGETFNSDAVTAAFTTVSSDTLSPNDVAFVMAIYMLSSDTDSTDLADWEWLQPGDVYEEGKHYTLITEFYYENNGDRPDRFLTNSSYDVIAYKTVNGLTCPKPATIPT